MSFSSLQASSRVTGQLEQSGQLPRAIGSAAGRVVSTHSGQPRRSGFRQPRQPGRDRPRFLSPAGQQHRELAHIGFEGAGDRRRGSRSSHGTQPATLMCRNRSGSTPVRLVRASSSARRGCQVQPQGRRFPSGPSRVRAARGRPCHSMSAIRCSQEESASPSTGAGCSGQRRRRPSQQFPFEQAPPFGGPA